MKNYKELEVWQRSVDLAVQSCKLTRSFPPEERFGLSAQIRGAATSVPANIAEGWGRGSTKEYIQFLTIARGSLTELETHSIIAQKLQYLAKRDFEIVQEQVEVIGKMLNGLIRALKATREARGGP